MATGLGFVWFWYHCGSIDTILALQHSTGQSEGAKPCTSHARCCLDTCRYCLAVPVFVLAATCFLHSPFRDFQINPDHVGADWNCFSPNAKPAPWFSHRLPWPLAQRLLRSSAAPNMTLPGSTGGWPWYRVPCGYHQHLISEMATNIIKFILAFDSPNSQVAPLPRLQRRWSAKECSPARGGSILYI